MATLQVMFNQALSSFQAGQLEVATREIDRALSSDPQNPDVLHLAALIAKSKYNYAKSEEYFRGSLEYSAKQPVVLSNLANLLKTMGRFAEANKAYLAAIEILPSFRDAWLNRGLLAKEMLAWNEAKTGMTKA